MERPTETISVDILVLSDEFRRGVRGNLNQEPFEDIRAWPNSLYYEIGRLAAAKFGHDIQRYSHRNLVYCVLGMLQNGEITG